MHSCLYKAMVMHYRLEPKKHQFHYKVFMFYLDLDEIDQIADRLRWISRNRFNLFNFRDKDHLQLPIGAPDQHKTTREHITEYLRSQQVDIGNGKIRVLTNLRTLGHQFNPVSFYFCYDEQGHPLCAVAEVGNTFGEMKPYFLGESVAGRFRLNTIKHFYVSPFIGMDTHFDFDLAVPDEKLRIRIDDLDPEGNRFFISTLTGSRKELTDANLLRYFFSIPLITLKVIGGIHWEAFRLWLKKIPHHKKEGRKIKQKQTANG